MASWKSKGGRRLIEQILQEIIGGMLDLDHRLWRTNEYVPADQQRENTAKLKRLWEPFDWTKQTANEE
ncbi:unnamed protein product [Gongylonema pulchrum]|uniref:CwfJ_C_2 domain-containing protein n=1 Tax=Gongylonema pulchrum TaxID=637853 RepID=A0A183DM50_9BILA|nr:unnamed protein product [Gongylonema pulchrum]